MRQDERQRTFFGLKPACPVPRVATTPRTEQSLAMKLVGEPLAAIVSLVRRWRVPITRSTVSFGAEPQTVGPERDRKRTAIRGYLDRCAGMLPTRTNVGRRKAPAVCVTGRDDRETRAHGRNERR